MQHGLEAGRLDYLVKGAFLRNVRDDDDVERLPPEVLVGIADLLRLVLGADRSDDLMARREQLLEDVR